MARVATVLVIAPPKERSQFVQPRGIERPDIFRNTVNFLVDVRLHQVKHAIGFACKTHWKAVLCPLSLAPAFLCGPAHQVIHDICQPQRRY